MYDEETGLTFPIFQRDLTDTFGDPRSAQFKNDYLTFVDLSELQAQMGHISGLREENGFGFTACWVMEKPLVKAFKNLIAANLIQKIKTFDGCVCVRPMKTNANVMSVHSWGMAIDLNASTNPCSGSFQTDWTPPFVKCFTDAGFEWGGLWSGTYDTMHFQLPWIRDWQVQSARTPWPTPQPWGGVATPTAAPTQETTLAKARMAIFKKAASTYVWPSEVIQALAADLGPDWMTWVLMGIDSRESRFGILLDKHMLGDNGHGHGEMQIDDRSHPAFCNGDGWKDLAQSLEYVHHNVIVPSYNYLTDYFDLFDSDYEKLFWGGIAGYNCGEGNVRKALEAGDDVDARTTGSDYSKDVHKRARQLRASIEG